MATLKQLIDEYGLNCKVGWKYLSKENTCILLNMEGESLVKTQNGKVISFLGLDSLSDYYYVSGGDKVTTNRELNKTDLSVIEHIMGVAIDELKSRLRKDLNSYIDNDMLELINELNNKNNMISVADTKISSLSRICENLMMIVGELDDYLYVPSKTIKQSDK